MQSFQKPDINSSSVFGALCLIFLAEALNTSQKRRENVSSGSATNLTAHFIMHITVNLNLLIGNHCSTKDENKNKPIVVVNESLHLYNMVHARITLNISFLILPFFLPDSCCIITEVWPRFISRKAI